jgi:hypothetical protein
VPVDQRQYRSADDRPSAVRDLAGQRPAVHRRLDELHVDVAVAHERAQVIAQPLEGGRHRFLGEGAHPVARRAQVHHALRRDLGRGVPGGSVVERAGAEHGQHRLERRGVLVGELGERFHPHARGGTGQLQIVGRSGIRELLRAQRDDVPQLRRGRVPVGSSRLGEHQQGAVARDRVERLDISVRGGDRGAPGMARGRGCVAPRRARGTETPSTKDAAPAPARCPPAASATRNTRAECGISGASSVDSRDGMSAGGAVSTSARPRIVSRSRSTVWLCAEVMPPP